jgi:hypothetical protein
MTGEIDAEGYFGSTKHQLIHFRFSDVLDFDLQHFDIPNTLFEMTFSPSADYEAARRFTVELASVLGGDCAACFSAGSGEIVSIKPCNQNGVESVKDG